MNVPPQAPVAEAAAGCGAPPEAVLPWALATALDDEYRARATYEAVLRRFGSVAPFSRIRAAEERHIAALEEAFHRYRLPLPPDRWRGRVTAPASLLQACRDGVRGEIGNYQMYDRLLTQVQAADVRAVFTNLRNASAYNHLPAFAACAGDPAPADPPTVRGTSRTPLVAGVIAGAALGVLLARADRASREAPV